MWNNQTTARHTEDYRTNVLSNAQVIQNVQHGGYKYLEVLEADLIKQDEMKDTVRTEYFRRVRRLLRSKTISAINTWAVSLVRYTAGIVKCRKDELETMFRRCRKLMTIYNSLHPRLMCIACMFRGRKEADDSRLREHGKAESKQVSRH